jgi:hypothetical protein
LFLSPIEILPPKLPDALADVLKKYNLTIPTPPRTILKQAYDAAGTVVTLMLINFAAAPFILWYWNTSLEAWRRMNWYGLWIVGLTFAFFYGGGAVACRKLNQERIKRAPKDAVKEIIGENYVHPTLRTPEMQGTGLQNIAPVNEVALEIEALIETLVDKIKAEGKLRKQS